MARAYAKEAARLTDAFAWVAEMADLDPVREAVRRAAHLPLRAIGSGGSLTCAHALSALHQRYTGCLATIATPLEVIDEPLDATASAWLLSAGGNNVDILAAAESLIQREPRQIGVLCGQVDSPLAELCRQHPYVELLVYPPPTGKDGFLATNSLLGFTALLTRAYVTEFGSSKEWQDTVDWLTPLLPVDSAVSQEWLQATAPLWERPTTVVLYGASTRIGAIDLESKFTEAALGHVQLADYRNFAHGRHHWLAKHSATSAVLAFVTDADRALAERTLDLLPENIPQAQIAFEGCPSTTGLASLVAALKIAGWAGISRGIDPGRPGVPQFGRKLYHLPLRRLPQTIKSPILTFREAAAIRRKANAEPRHLEVSGELAHWREALATFSDSLGRSRFAGIVLDYDGTVVDTRHRFDPPAAEMVSEITRLASSGVRLAFATGRGRSARTDLQRCLPRALWPRILVGYYNGAEISSLDDDTTPARSTTVGAPLLPISEALRRQSELLRNARQEDRRFQITLQPIRPMPPGRLWNLVQHEILHTGTRDLGVTRSGHSIDIVAPGVTKLNVVKQLRKAIGEAPVLVIGDRGRWPGNDHELLAEPFALGVDEISADPATCWHLGEPGQRGPSVTLDYLSGLQAADDQVKFTNPRL